MTRALVKWKCKLLLLPYCCHFLEAESVSAARENVVLKRYCVRYTVTGRITIYVEMAGRRSVWDIKIVWSRFLGIPRSNTGIIDDGSEVAQEREEERDQTFLRIIPYWHGHLFLKILWNSAKYKEWTIISSSDLNSRTTDSWLYPSCWRRAP